jgi:hypothetical protein
MANQQKLTVNTLDALSVAIMAYVHNENKIVRFGPGNNKDFIYGHFIKFSEVDVSEYYERANSIRDSLNQRVMLNTLVGNDNGSFLLELNDLIQNPSVSNLKFGIIAWAPKLFDDIVKNENVRETVIGLSVNSNYLGKIGKKVELTFNLIDCKYIKDYDRFVHLGHDDQGNLVSTWHKTKIESGSKITARVKNHSEDKRYSDAPITVLNYVKVVDEK